MMAYHWLALGRPLWKSEISAEGQAAFGAKFHEVLSRKLPWWVGDFADALDKRGLKNCWVSADGDSRLERACGFPVVPLLVISTSASAASGQIQDVAEMAHVFLERPLADAVRHAAGSCDIPEPRCGLIPVADIMRMNTAAPVRRPSADAVERAVRVVGSVETPVGQEPGVVAVAALQALAGATASRLFRLGELGEFVDDGPVAAAAVANAAGSASEKIWGGRRFSVSASFRRRDGSPPSDTDLVDVQSSLGAAMEDAAGILADRAGHRAERLSFPQLLNGDLRRRSLDQVEAALSGKSTGSSLEDISAAAIALSKVAKAIRENTPAIGQEEGDLARRARGAASWVLDRKPGDLLRNEGEGMIRKALIKAADIATEMAPQVGMFSRMNANILTGAAKKARDAAGWLQDVSRLRANEGREI